LNFVKNGLPPHLDDENSIASTDAGASIKSSKHLRSTVDKVVALGFTKLHLPLPSCAVNTTNTVENTKVEKPSENMDVHKYVDWLNEQLRGPGGLLQDTGRTSRRTTKVDHSSSF